MGIKEALERARLPANENLWKAVSDYPDTKKALQKRGGCCITLLGTDPDASLINLILENTSDQTNLTVIEKRRPTILSAAKNTQQEKRDRVQFLDGSFPEVIPYQKPDLVIAKHFIHFCSAPKLVSEVTEIIAGSGLFFASTPRFLCDFKTRRELNKAKIPFEEKNFGGLGDGGVLFVIRFGVETPKICPLLSPSPAF